MTFFAGSVAFVYELPCVQQKYHLVANSVSGRARLGLPN
jgi:hypothetical protein